MGDYLLPGTSLTNFRQIPFCGLLHTAEHDAQGLTNAQLQFWEPVGEQRHYYTVDSGRLPRRERRCRLAWPSYAATGK